MHMQSFTKVQNVLLQSPSDLPRVNRLNVTALVRQGEAAGATRVRTSQLFNFLVLHLCYGALRQVICCLSIACSGMATVGTLHSRAEFRENTKRLATF